MKPLSCCCRFYFLYQPAPYERDPGEDGVPDTAAANHQPGNQRRRQQDRSVDGPEAPSCKRLQNENVGEVDAKGGSGHKADQQSAFLRKRDGLAQAPYTQGNQEHGDSHPLQKVFIRPARLAGQAAGSAKSQEKSCQEGQARGPTVRSGMIHRQVM